LGKRGKRQGVLGKKPFFLLPIRHRGGRQGPSGDRLGGGGAGGPAHGGGREMA
jgi:hypothetical protein